MAKKVQKPAPTWTTGEVALAERLRDYASNRKGTFLEKFGAAAQAYGYRSYADLPSGTKSYISSLGGKRKSTPPIPKKRKARGKIDNNYVDPRHTEWYQELEKSKSMQRALLHPEDDAGLIASFEKGE